MMVSRNPDVSNLWTVISIVVGVFSVSALFGWMMFRAAKSWERADLDPRYRRRKLILGAAIYVVAIVIGLSQVIRGNEPVETLAGLPIVLLLVYWLLRTASHTKIPPQ